MKPTVSAIQDKMEATIHFIWSELQETIKYRVEDVLSYVDQKMQGLCREVTEKIGKTQVDLQAVKTSLEWSINPVIQNPIYVVQSIISWIGRIMVLLCTTADTWSHKMVPCQFFSHASKKQLHACSVFRKKVTAVTGSCLRAVEIKNLAV
jgi:hypothetical protein